MVAMGTRRPRKGSRLCRRWALTWREDGQLLDQCLRATKRDKLSEDYCHDIMQIFHLPDGDVRAVLCVIALDGGGIGVTAIDSDGLRDPVAVDRLREKP